MPQQPDFIPAADTPDFIPAMANAPQQPEGVVSRFLTRATGVPIQDIRNNPRAYMPWTKEYWDAARANAGQPAIDYKHPGGQIQADIESKNYAGVAGDLVQPTLALLGLRGSLRAPAGEVIPPTSPRILDIPANYRTVPGDIAPEQVGAPRPPNFVRIRGQLPAPAEDNPQPAAPVSKKVPTGGTAAPTTEEMLMQQRFRLGHLQDQLRSASPEEVSQIQTEIDATKDTLERLNPRAARPQPAAQKQGYPEGIQKRPTERGEVVSDKAIEDAMRNDLERHGWSALSQERKEFYANNQPGMAKGDLITQARVDAIRAEAEQRVQQALAEANKPVKYTKTKTPKAKAAAAPENAVPDLNNPDVLMNLMKRSLKDLSGK